MDEMIRLNVGALTRLTYAAAPGFVARGGGTIINIASIVAISPETLNGVYGASKAFVLAFSHSLQQELAQKGVRVQAVLPGATATEFWDIAGLPVQNLPAEIVMSAEDIVDAALAGLDQGEIVTRRPSQCIRLSRLEPQDVFSSARLDTLSDPRGPELKGTPLFIAVIVKVINAMQARRRMRDAKLGDVICHGQRAKVGPHRAPQIVEPPRCYWLFHGRINADFHF